MREINFMKGQLKYLILKVLSEQDSHGYEIAKVIEKETLGTWKPSPGSLYPSLRSMEEKGWVKAKQAKGKRKTKEYTITKKGRDEFEREEKIVQKAEAKFMECVKFHKGYYSMSPKERIASFKKMASKMKKKEFTRHRDTMLEFMALHREGKISRENDALFENKVLELLDAVKKINKQAGKQKTNH